MSVSVVGWAMNRGPEIKMQHGSKIYRMFKVWRLSAKKLLSSLKARNSGQAIKLFNSQCQETHALALPFMLQIHGGHVRWVRYTELSLRNDFIPNGQMSLRNDFILNGQMNFESLRQFEVYQREEISRKKKNTHFKQIAQPKIPKLLLNFQLSF